MASVHARQLPERLDQWKTLRVRLSVAACVCVLVVLCGAGGACGAGPLLPQDEAFPPVFSGLARVLAPIPVYGLRELPQGSAVSEYWWPIVEFESATDYAGPSEPNPVVRGLGGEEPEAQLLLHVGQGTIAVLENFRGDLGDVRGILVGRVAQHPATLYKLGSGILVQWSDTGRWYGVFGRGISREQITSLALDMERVPAEDSH